MESKKIHYCDKLFEIAQLQNGYFTSQQAISAGYNKNNFKYYITHGHWTREAKGVYRLVRYPVSDTEHYTLWSLWTHNKEGVPQGIYSYTTALGFYELSDVTSMRLHMSVPKNYRISKEIPKILVLYKEHIDPQDTKSMDGFRITKPYKTLIDIARTEMISRHHLADAIRQAINRGYVTNKFIKENPVFNFMQSYIPDIFK